MSGLGVHVVQRICPEALILSINKHTVLAYKLEKGPVFWSPLAVYCGRVNGSGMEVVEVDAI